MTGKGEKERDLDALKYYMMACETTKGYWIGQ